MNYQHRDSTLLIEDGRLNQTKSRALGGDGAAAWDLYLHYSLGVRDEDEATVWLNKAVDLGNLKAIKMKRIKEETERP